MGGHFDVEEKEKRIKYLEELTNEDGFWNDIKKANEVNKELTSLKKIVDKLKKLHEDVVLNLELINMLSDEELNMQEQNIKELEENIANLEINTLLNGKYDACDCYLEIHPGAGGTESCDFAMMLERMYERFCEKYNYKWVIIEEQKGDEAGIKSVTIKISGEYAYGYFKNEKGVHRLVRISPFDSNKRRHTSFASVSVTPLFQEDIDIDLKESDLKIDVYHSSGAGGQSVNTSNSAVRITHLKTKIVVTCQNERSQLKNKEMAMQILKNKLYQLKIEEQEKQKKEIKGINENINFGSQIRNYILEPYKQVKDLRSGYVSYDVFSVLDGNILEIMQSLLKMEKTK